VSHTIRESNMRSLIQRVLEDPTSHARDSYEQQRDFDMRHLRGADEHKSARSIGQTPARRAPRSRARRSTHAKPRASSGSSDSGSGEPDPDPDPAPETDPPPAPDHSNQPPSPLSSLLWDATDLAHHLRRSLRGIYNSVSEKRWDLIPRPIHIGRNVRWRPADVQAWVDDLAAQQLGTQTSRRGPGRPRKTPSLGGAPR
jgi:predicted DNA-binding transcriptional regulator AlpA